MKSEDFKSIEGYDNIIEKLKTGYDDKVLCVSCPFSGNNSARGGSCAYNGYSDGMIGKGDFDPRLKDSAIEFEKLKVVMEEKGDRYLVDEEFAKEVGKKIDTNERFRFDPFTGFESQMELSVWDKYITGLERTCVMYREEVEELYHKYSSIGLNERITELTKESNDLFRQKQDVWRKHDEIKEIAKQNKVSCEKLTQENKKIKKDNMEFVKERGYLAERIEECKAENNLLVELLKIKL